MLREDGRHLAVIESRRENRGSGGVNTLDAARHTELEDGANHWVDRHARQSLSNGDVEVWHAAIGLLQKVHDLNRVSNLKGREIDDDIIALARRLLVKLREIHGINEEVAIIGNHLERDLCAVCLDKCELQKARHTAIGETETVFSRQYLKERGVTEVYERHVTEEAVGVKDVKE